MATRFNDRRTAAAVETSADYPVYVGPGSGAFSRPANLNSAEQNTPVNNRPTLTGWGPSVTFAENLVNATPQLLDADVVFDDLDGNFNGGRLTLSGLLAEDRASVRNEGTGAGQIGLSGANVTFGGVVIGTLAGGSGATLTITFNAATTSAAVDALIQNLTYANISDAPTASRNLVLNVIDAAGAPIAAMPAIFSQRIGASNPFDGVYTLYDAARPDFYWPTLTFADLDGDGDLDAVAGNNSGVLNYFQNTGTATAPIFTYRTGAANPFDGFYVGGRSKPTFVDLDGDGDLDAMVGAADGTIRYFQNVGTATAPIFAQLTAGNPFNGVDLGSSSAPTFADLDGDGDLDAVVGEADGVLNYFQNTGTATAPIFTERTGAANPFNGVDVGSGSTPTFADLDGDGDLDAVIGESDGVLNYFQNTGTATAPIFTERTGAANPFNGAVVVGNSAPTFADLDGDGDLDAVIGEGYTTVRYYQNIGVAPITVNVTAQNDPPKATGLPTDVTVAEDLASNLDLSAVTLAGAETIDFINVVLTASAGTMTARSGSGVDVNNSGTGAITLTGSSANIDAFLNTASNIQYTGAFNASGDNAATVTITANDGSGAVTLGTVNVDITPVNDLPTLTGFGASVSFAENLVKATPQLLDADVVFNDLEGNFNGGRLTLSGLLAEDRASVRNEGTGAGQIGLSGANVTFGGVIIGTLAGGSGATLTITFNAAATSAAVDALIQNLTYANVSDAPTASRALVLSITDAVAADAFYAFTERTGAANPLNAVDAGYASAPTFADLDGDGDLDAVVGSDRGDLRYFENTGTATAPIFTTARIGAANPLNAVDVDYNSRPTFADLDSDGDLDAVVGGGDGPVRYFVNTGTATAPIFNTERIGAANPFNGMNFGYSSAPTFADLDGDGDLDAVVGGYEGVLRYFQNTGTATAPIFTELTGTANPFNGVDLVYSSAPTFADLDGDGDLDAVVGASDGILRYFQNTGTANAPNFTQGINGVDVGTYCFPTFADLDGDGYLDAVVGREDGGLSFFQRPIVQATINVITVNGVVLSGADHDETLTGTSRDDSLSGLGGNDQINGGDGDDLIDGGHGDDRIFAGSGNDTMVGGIGNNVIDGGAGWDIVTVSGLASAYRVLKDGDNFILKGPGGGDSLTNVEAIRFADGKVLDLARMYGPDVDASAWADGRIPEALLSDVASSEERPLVLPGAGGDDVLVAKDDGEPEVLPAVDDVVPSAKVFDGPEVLPAAPVDKFLVEAEVLPPLPGDHFSAEVPEVLPALDDGFLVMGKFDDLPPVMPTLPDDIDLWDVAAVFRPGSETLALILERAEHPYGHSLTLLDERPAVPSKDDAWE